MKRITLFAGHYGSGKTNIAVNYAKFIKSEGFDVSIIDLDIVNPYFRTKDSEEDLKKCGIELVSSEYANTNLDAPALPKEIYARIADKSKKLVIDVGGDDRGAVALGRFAPDITDENDFEMLFVANFYRPLTQIAEDALQVMREIELAGHIRFTGIVHNSNIGDETTAFDITKKEKELKKLAELSKLPVVFTAVSENVYPEFQNSNSELFKLELQKKYYKIEKEI
ncbi:MAG: hypothetical protein IK057_01290 [Clostridia bacterium]|nr:hypothetical protein [Clostridia bacterium]